MRSRRWTAVLLILFVLLGASAVVAANSTGQVVTVEGVAVELNPETEAEFKSQLDSIAKSAGISGDYNFSVVYTKGRTTFVLTTEPIETGEVAVTGSILVENDEARFVHGEHVLQIEAGESSPFRDLVDSPADDAHQLTSVDAYLASAPYLLDAGDKATYQTGSMTLSPRGNYSWPSIDVGRMAAFLTVEGSGNLENVSRESVLTTLTFPPANDFVVGQAAGDTVWAMRGNATVDIATAVQSNGPTHYVVDVHPDSTETVTPSQLARNGEAYQGEIVTVRGIGAGARISTQEALARASGCGNADAVNVPSVGCIPVPTDATVHAGILTSQSGGQGVVYVGMSNIHTASVLATETGEYDLFGRVVDASEVDPRFNTSSVLVVYDRNRLGDASVSQLRDSADDIVEILRSQITMSDKEWEAVQRMPTPTATANPTPIGTDTATESTQTLTEVGGQGGGEEQPDSIDHVETEDTQPEDSILNLVGIIGGMVGASGLGLIGAVTGLEVTFGGNANRRRLAIWLGAFLGITIVGLIVSSLGLGEIGLIAILFLFVGGWGYLGISVMKSYVSD